MLQFIFLPLLLCSQYAASIPVFSSVYSQEANVTLRLHIVPATWVEAALLCQLEGGILASPTTNALAEAMQTAMANNQLLSNGVFIGVTDLLSKGDYKSLDGAPVADIPLEWAAGEPNNADNAQNCLALTGAGILADVSCSMVLPYFCRKQSANNSNTDDKGTPVVPSCNGRNDYKWEPRTGSCYKFHRVGETWFSALQTCQAEGGHLAIVNNKKEQAVIQKIYNRVPDYKITGTYYAGTVMIGFRKSDNGDWVTIDGESLSKAGFDEWSSGEPNNYHEREENCGAINRNGLLNDAPCNIPYSHAFICEITP